jgi:hypothetical protein
LIEYQQLSGESFGSVPEDYCTHPQAHCECTDDVGFGADWYGACETYGFGGMNAGLCALDGACDACKMSCAADDSCGPERPCQDVASELHFLRQASNWPQVPSLRGAAGFTHFEVDGEHYLAVAQTTCDSGQSIASCNQIERVHAKSAILQWDGFRFGHVLSAPPESVEKYHRHVHDYAFRIAAGACFKWLFLELPTESSLARYLVSFSLTSQVAAVPWTFSKVTNMRCARGIAVTQDDDKLYTVSAVDHALVQIVRRRSADALGREVSRLSIDRTWVEGSGDVRGLYSIQRIQVIGQDVVVYSGLPGHEQLCGNPSLTHRIVKHNESDTQDVVNDRMSWQSIYNTACQEYQFSVEFEGGDPTLLVDLPAISSQGTLMLEVAPLKSGTALYRVFMSDLVPGGKRSSAEYFAIQVSKINHAPSFRTQNLSVDEDTEAHELEFAFDLSPGPDTELDQAMQWKFSLTNDYLFLGTPVMVVEGGAGGIGKVLFQLAPNASGVSSVLVTLIDSGGTIPARFVPMTNAIGRDESDAQIFTIEVKPKNDAPYFEMGQHIELSADAGHTKLEKFAFNISAGPNNEALQELTFVLTSVVNAGTLFVPDLFFSEAPSLDLDGTLTFAPAARVSGTVLFTFTLFDSGGNGDGDSNSFSRSARLSVESVNNAPSFDMEERVIQVASAASLLRFEKKVLANISKGALDEDFLQAVTFVVESISNQELFAQLPTLDDVGSMSFTLAPGANGTATVSFFLKDDGGNLHGGQDFSERDQLTIQVSKTNAPPAFELETLYIVLVQDSGPYVLANFAQNISKGSTDESNQRLFFNVTLQSLSPNLFDAEPMVDEEGTLNFRTAVGAYGTAIANIKLTDSGGTEYGGVDETVPPRDVPTLTFMPCNDCLVVSRHVSGKIDRDVTLCRVKRRLRSKFTLDLG